MPIIKRSTIIQELSSSELSTYTGTYGTFVKNTDTSGFVFMDGVTPGGVFEINDDNTLDMEEIIPQLPNVDVPLSVEEVIGIAQGSSQDLEQSLLANDAQPAKTVLAVGYSTSGKVQGVSLGKGNVVIVYASGSDFVKRKPLYTEFMALGEPICFTGLANGAIITSTEGFYGMSEQDAANANKRSPMPLLSLGLSFTDTFFYAFRNSATNQGKIRIVNGALKSKVTLYDDVGAVVLGQQNVEIEPWGFLTMDTNGNGEYRLVSNNKIMACIHAGMDIDGFYDSRLIMPLTNDGITWPRSGFISALYANTKLEYFVRDGASLSEGSGITITRPNISGSQTNIAADVNGLTTSNRINFTTPASPPSAGNIKAIWDSGGVAIGVCLAIMPDWSLGLTWATAVSTAKANTTPILPNTRYSVIVDFIQSSNEIRIHVVESTNYDWYFTERVPELLVTNANELDNISGTGEFSLGGSFGDPGGYNPVPASYAFDGVINSDFTSTRISTPVSVSPGSPVDFDGVTGADDQDYEPDGATRIKAQGLVSAFSGADSAGYEATPLMPTNVMSQIVAQPFNISDSGDGGNSSVAIASVYSGTAWVYQWNDVSKKAELVYTVPLNRRNTTLTQPNDQNIPTAGLVANESVSGSISLVGTLGAGYVISDVPITVVSQSTVGGTIVMRSQSGTTSTGILTSNDETLMLGHTPEEIKFEGRIDPNGYIRKRVVEVDGSENWVLA